MSIVSALSWFQQMSPDRPVPFCIPLSLSLSLYSLVAMQMWNVPWSTCPVLNLCRLRWTLDWSVLCEYALIINDLPVLRFCADLKPLQLNYIGDINTYGAKLTTVICDGSCFLMCMNVNNTWYPNIKKQKIWCWKNVFPPSFTSHFYKPIG